LRSFIHLTSADSSVPLLVDFQLQLFVAVVCGAAAAFTSELHGWRNN
jgi:hypothetical protein